MGKRRFEVHFEGSGIIELDDAVFDAVDDEWRSVFYNLNTLTDIAEHVGYNLIINRVQLSHLDGWADQPDENARVLEKPDWEVEAEIARRH